MSKQPEALKLAEELHDAAGDYTLFYKTLGYMAASELRRLHEVNQELVEELTELLSWQSLAPEHVVLSAKMALAKATGDEK